METKLITDAKGIVRRIVAQRSRTTIIVPDGWKVRYDSSLMNLGDDSGHPNHSGTFWISVNQTAFTTVSFDPGEKCVYVLFSGDKMIDDQEEKWVRAKVEVTGTDYQAECYDCGNLAKLWSSPFATVVGGEMICDDCMKKIEAIG